MEKKPGSTWWLWVGTIIWLLWLTAWVTRLMPRAHLRADTLTATAFRLVDDEGQVRGRWAQENQDVSLTMSSQKDDRGLEIRVLEGGDFVLRFWGKTDDAQATPYAKVSLISDYHATTLKLYQPSGPEGYVWCRVSRKGEPEITLRNGETFNTRRIGTEEDEAGQK